MVRLMQCLGVAILAGLNSRGNAFTAVPHLAIGLHMSVGTSMGFKSPIAHRGRIGKRLGMSSTASAPEEEKKGFIGRFKAGIPPAEERKKLIPLAMMFFCILFNYTVLRDTKDVLLVTAPKSGAEVIPFLKTYCNLPSAIGFAALYSKLCDRMEQRNVFYAIVIPFLIFFASFALVIYPNNAFLHPHALVDKIALLLPAGASAPLAIVRNWSFAMFYVLAEMWGSVVTSLLFWGFANEVTTVEEAKKYCTYALRRMTLNDDCWTLTSQFATPRRSFVRFRRKRRVDFLWSVCSMGVWAAGWSWPWC